MNIPEWDKKNGIASMQEFYDQHKEGFPLGDTNPIFKTKIGDKPYLGDFLFTRMVNEDGVIQIGNDVYTFDLNGKRIKTDAKLFGKTQKNSLDAVSDVSIYSVKLLGNMDTDQEKGARKMVPDLPLPGIVKQFDNEHVAIGVFSQSNIFFFYSSFALKMQMREYSGWWIFKSWGSGTADYLGISSGHVRLSSQGNVVLDQYGISGSCTGCSEAYGYAGSVSFTFGGNIDQIQGVFDATYGGQSAQMLLP